MKGDPIQRIRNNPARIIGFIAAVAGGVAAGVTVGMSRAQVVLVAIPVISAEVTRWFVSPVPPERRGFK